MLNINIDDVNIKKFIKPKIQQCIINFNNKKEIITLPPINWNVLLVNLLSQFSTEEILKLCKLCRLDDGGMKTYKKKDNLGGIYMRNDSIKIMFPEIRKIIKEKNITINIKVKINEKLVNIYHNSSDVDEIDDEFFDTHEDYIKDDECNSEVNNQGVTKDDECNSEVNNQGVTKDDECNSEVNNQGVTKDDECNSEVNNQGDTKDDECISEVNNQEQPKIIDLEDDKFTSLNNIERLKYLNSIGLLSMNIIHEGVKNTLPEMSTKTQPKLKGVDKLLKDAGKEKLSTSSHRHRCWAYVVKAASFKSFNDRNWKDHLQRDIADETIFEFLESAKRGILQDEFRKYYCRDDENFFDNIKRALIGNIDAIRNSVPNTNNEFAESHIFAAMICDKHTNAPLRHYGELKLYKPGKCDEYSIQKDKDTLEVAYTDGNHFSFVQ
jgi:hypothetical protein